MSREQLKDKTAFSNKPDREHDKNLHDHLSPGKQRVADELARPQGNGSVGHFDDERQQESALTDSRIKKCRWEKAAAREGGCRSSLSNCRIAIELNIRCCAGWLWARLGQASLFWLVHT